MGKAGFKKNNAELITNLFQVKLGPAVKIDHYFREIQINMQSGLCLIPNYQYLRIDL